MGIRGEIFSSKLVLDRRTFFFNVKENRMGAKFLNLVESRKGSGEEFERTQIMIYEEDIAQFMHELEKAAEMLRSASNKHSKYPPTFAEHKARLAGRENNSSRERNDKRENRNFRDRSSATGKREDRPTRFRPSSAAKPGSKPAAKSGKPLKVRRKTTGTRPGSMGSDKKVKGDFQEGSFEG